MQTFPSALLAALLAAFVVTRVQAQPAETPKRVFVVNSAAATVDVLDIQNPAHHSGEHVPQGLGGSVWSCS